TLPNLYRAWHAFAAPGRYDVVLTVSNLTDRASATVTVEVVETAYYVSPDGTHTPPFTNWATAAHDIQSAIDAATAIGATVWVAPGDYATGGRAMSDLSIYDRQNANRVAVFKPLTIRSSGGPAVTRIVGSGTNGPERTRGVYLTDYSSLIGFTVTNGCANAIGWGMGGGIFCEPRAIVSNCVIVGNVTATVGGRIYDSRIARNIGSFGVHSTMGGWFVRCLIEENSKYTASYSKFWNCVMRNNRGFDMGDCRGYGCTIVGNRQGTCIAYEGAFHNCIFHDNDMSYLMSSDPVSYTFLEAYDANWTFPDPGCIIQPDPKFVDYAAGDYRLRADSPCIDAGTNSRAWWAQIPEGSALVNPIDGNRDGYARCDMGAFEYSPVPAMPSGLTATAAATNRIELAWADNASNESGYLVARSPDSTDWVLVTLTGANATNYSDSGLATNTLYYYRVAASNAAGLSAYGVVTGRTWTVYEQWRQTQFDAVSLTNAAVSSDTADPDHHGLNNQQEFWAGTNPTNASSCLVLYATTNNPSVDGKFVVRWQSVDGKRYALQATTNLLSGFTNVMTHIPATPTVNVHTDSVPGVGCKFYRVLSE
ncbi:MAG: fibronectin type III domain-containing protein, partial [bacterium]